MEPSGSNIVNSSTIKSKILSGEWKIIQKRGRSKVWDLFGIIQDMAGLEIPNLVACRTCFNAYKVSNQSTSNLFKHKCYLKKKIYETDNDLEAEVHPEIKADLLKIFTEWAIENCRPFKFVQDSGFLKVAQSLISIGATYGRNVNIKSLLPHPADISENINNIYTNNLQNVKAEIVSIKDNGFGLTSDLWEDEYLKQSYLSLTIHYAIKEGTLVTRLLGMKCMKTEKCTSRGISNEIRKILDNFECELSNKSILVADLSNSLIKTLPYIHHMPCMSHLLSDALFTSMDNVPEMLAVKNSCTDLVNYLRVEGYDNLLIDLANNSYQNSWITMYKTMICIENNWNEIEIILLDMNEKGRISSINLGHLKAAIKFLHPFEEAIDTLEDDTSATLHLVIVYLHELKKACDADAEFQDIEFIEQLKDNLRNNLQKIEAEHITILHKLALFLFPPTNKLLQFNYKEKRVIEDECIRLMQNYKHEVKQLVRKTKVAATSSEAPESKRRKLFLDFVEPQPNDDVNEHYNHEIELYKNTRVTNSTDLDVFNWWHLQKDTFPLLYKISCTILATPATCAASKRVLFKRNSMNDPKIEKILFVNTNTKPDELESNSSILDQE